MNTMQQVRIEKITLNFGGGKDQKRLEKGIKLIKEITHIEPVKTATQKRIQGWGLRPGLPIGCKVTLRKDLAKKTLKRLLHAKDFQLKETNFDQEGNLAFGIHEYIDVEGVKYDPEIGVLGLEVAVTLERPGFRVKRRSRKAARIGKKHRITREESIAFMKKEYNTKIGDDE